MTTAPAARAVDRRLLALAVPALFTLAAEPLYVLADTAIVGHLGTASLGGLGLAGIVLTSAAGLCNVLTWGTTSRVAFLRGANRPDAIGRVAATVFWLALGLGGAFAAVLAAGASPILRALGGEGLVLARATTYLQIGALGLPALLLAWAGQGVARGEGDTRGPLAVVIAANVVNLLLEIVFVYGFEWGMAGSAWGTVLAQWGAALVFAARLLRRAQGARAPDRGEFSHIARVSGPLVVRTGALLAALTLASSVAARLDAVSLGAHQVLAQLHLFAALVVDSVAIAVQTLVAEAWGADDDAGFALVVRRATRLTAIGAGVLTLAFLLGSRAIPHVFTDDPRVVSAIIAVMPILAVIQLPGGVAYLFDGVVMGRGKFLLAMQSTLAGSATFAVFAVAVMLRPSLGLPVLWLGLGAWLVVRAAVNATVMRSQRATLVG